MKKLFIFNLTGLTMLAIITLSSFTSPQELSNNTLPQKQGISAQEAGKCTEYYKTWSSFSECYKTVVKAQQISDSQLAVLEKF
ncbi:hypothetical protein [Hydrotalea sp.]|uniref:hypothetical protein n=1 Tax=Hydrotalea sp. TaxID=2881279 RepID=UPI003D13568D